MGLLGYDNFAQQYVQLWMDNFMTGVIILKGSCGKSGREITVHGRLTKPIAGAESINVRWVYNIVSPDEFSLEMWEPDAHGDEYRHGKISYTRSK